VYDPAALATDLFTDFHHGLLRQSAERAPVLPLRDRAPSPERPGCSCCPRRPARRPSKNP